MKHPSNQVDLIKMVRSILRVPEATQQAISDAAEASEIFGDDALEEFAAKYKQSICPECNGSGLDKAHKWPDGSFASCEQCEGYGTIKE